MTSHLQRSDMAKALLRAYPSGLIAMHMSIAFNVNALIDCDMTKDVASWSHPDLVQFMNRLNGRVDGNTFEKMMYQLVQPGARLACPAAVQVLAQEQTWPSSRLPGDTTHVQSSMVYDPVRWTNKIDSWTVYFAEFAMSDVAKTRVYAVTALALAHDRLHGLGIFKRVAALLLGTDKYPATLTIDQLLDKFPFAAPFVHACLALEHVSTEWRVYKDLVQDAHRHLLENLPVHALAGYASRQDLADCLAGRDDLKHGLINCIVHDAPGYVSNRGTLYANLDLVISYFDSRELSVPKALHYRRQNFLESMAAHSCPAPLAPLYPFAGAMEDAYHSEAAKRATTVHVHAPAGDWIDSVVRSIGLDEADALLLTTFLRKNKVSRDQLGHVPLDRLESIGIAWGPAHKIHTAFQSQERIQ